MKVIVQDRISGKFIFSPCSWTEKEEEALDFESPSRARHFCSDHFLRDAQIIVQHGGGMPEVRMAGTPEPEPLATSGWHEHPVYR